MNMLNRIIVGVSAFRAGIGYGSRIPYVRIIFSNAQTSNGAPTLKVGSTTAKTIRRITGTSAAQYEWCYTAGKF